jgi:hypothetical protein
VLAQAAALNQYNPNKRRRKFSPVEEVRLQFVMMLIP